MALQFLQLGDAHLGAALTGLPTPVADALRLASRQAVTDAFAEVSRRKLQLVLLPGDLFEQDGVDPASQLRFIYELADGVAPVPVVIAPGNHDSYHQQSAYFTEKPPRNVILFTSPALTAVETSAGSIVARAVQSGEGSSALNWSQLPAPAAPRLLVLHAALLQAADDRRHRDAIVPVTVDALRRSGFAYTALGHYHRYQSFSRDEKSNGGGPALAAYSGCPQGLGFDEPGPKGYLLGKLDDNGAQLEFIPSARHSFVRHKLVLPPEYARDMLGRLENLLEDAKAATGPEGVLDLEISGRWPLARRDELLVRVDRLRDALFYCRPLEWNRVEFSPPLVPRGQSAVLDEFLERCDLHISTGGPDTAAWQLAQYLGHRLLSGHGLPGEVAG